VADQKRESSASNRYDKTDNIFKTGFDFENVLIFSSETDFDALEKIEALFPEDEIER